MISIYLLLAAAACFGLAVYLAYKRNPYMFEEPAAQPPATYYNVNYYKGKK